MPFRAEKPTRRHGTVHLASVKREKNWKEHVGLTVTLLVWVNFGEFLLARRHDGWVGGWKVGGWERTDRPASLLEGM